MISPRLILLYDRVATSSSACDDISVSIHSPLSLAVTGLAQEQEDNYEDPDQRPRKKITPVRLLRFGKPELPLVISATFLAAISAFLNM